MVLGNPPWEKIKLQEKEWFSQRAPEIASAKNAAARKRLIANLAEENPELFVDFQAILSLLFCELYQITICIFHIK